MRNFRASEKFKGIVEKLAQSNHPVAERSIFPTIRDLLCFVAVLGFEYDRNKAISDKSYDIVDGRIMSNNQQTINLLYH
jgi:hypothetical protein